MAVTQLPALQLFMVRSVTEYIGETIHYPIKIGNIAITWVDELTLYNVEIRDTKNNKMIEVEKLVADFKLLALFNRDIIVEEAVVYHPQVRLAYDQDVKDVNMSDFIYSITHVGDDPNAPPSPPKIGRHGRFQIKKVTLKDGFCSYDDPGSSPVKDRFDFSHFKLREINLTASDFKIYADTVEMIIQGLSCVDQYSNLKVSNLDANFGICENFIRLEQLDATIGKSRLRDKVIFEFDDFSQLSYIEDSVMMKLNMDESSVHSEDLAVFLSEIKGFGEIWTVSGDIKGYFRDFKARDLQLKFGTSSYMQGDVSMKGMPDWDSTVLNIHTKRSLVYANDLKKYGLEDVSHILSRFNSAAISGTFKGYPTDFETEAFINSELGVMDLDMHMVIPSVNNKGEYSAYLYTKDLDIGKALDNLEFDKITSNFRINGEGFNAQNVDLTLNSYISSVGYKGYNYVNLTSNARFEAGYLHGSLDIQDPHLNLDLIGSLDVRNNAEKLEFHAGVSNADLQPLGFLKKNVSLSGDVRYNANGFTLQNLVGELDGSNMTIKDPTQSVNVDQFTIIIDKDANAEKNITIMSDILEANIHGVFDPGILWERISEMGHDLQSNLSFNDSLISGNYEKRLIKDKFFNTEWDIDVKRLNPVFNILVPGLKISPGTHAQGEFNSNTTNSLKFFISADTFSIGTFGLIGADLQMQIDKSRISREVSADAKLVTKYQTIDDATIGESLFCETSWNDNVIDFDFKIKQYKETNEAHLAGNLVMDEEGKHLRFLNSYVKLLDKDWYMRDDNQIVFKSNKVSFNNVELSNAEQKISATGNISPDENEAAQLLVENFELSNFNKLFGINIDGRLHANMQLKDIYTNPKVNSQVSINELKIRKFLIGNVNGNSNWDNIAKKLALDLDIERFGTRIFDVKGYYNPTAANKNEKLELTASLQKTDLCLIEPFFGEIISEIGGEATGKVKITGNPINPILNGKVKIKQGSLKVNYLNTTYTFADEIEFQKDRIIMDNVVLHSRSGKGIVNGGFFHNNYKNFTMDINGKFEKVEILNTLPTDSSLYYGTAVASGKFSIMGNFSDFLIKVDAVSEKGTSIFIPLNNSNSIAKYDFINFVKKGNIATKADGKRRKLLYLNNSVIEMDFNFEITPEAYCQIILDPASDDNISGFGNGKINLHINSDGDFTIYGNYIFERESYYSFSYSSYINKRFAIQRGSTVAFNGDPYGATMDVIATYDDRVPLYTIISDTSVWNKPGIKTPYPVSTIMYLKGAILKPTITYDIKIRDYPQVVSGVSLFNYVSAFENKIHSNENEMNYQVMGLLLFRRFLNSNTGLDQAIGGTVSELISSQVSNMISQIDPNLSVDFNVNGLTRDALNSMQVRVSYTLMDGKIRVTRSTGNLQNQNATANVIGDWTVEYMLTDDGKFRLKGFNRNNPNPLATGTSTAGNMSAGASIMHTASFNSINPFSRKRKKKAKAKLPPAPDPGRQDAAPDKK